MKTHMIKRREEAKERQAKRDKLTASEQLKHLSKRPGKSVREGARLHKHIEKNTVMNLEKEL
jgi:hypothetical protein